jgi:ubiquinone/menaquinone biosynthesis C-methylase UbiE
MLRSLLFAAFGVPSGLPGRIGGRLMATLNRGINAFAVDLLAPQPTDRVLEIGHGPGTALVLLAARVPDGLVIGVDPSREMAVQARQRTRQLRQHGRLALALATAERLPFAARQFDRVCSVNTLYFWPVLDDALAEIARVLRPGGRAVLAFRGQRRAPDGLRVRSVGGPDYTVAQVAEALARQGFRAVQPQTRRLPFITAVCLVAERAP